jgi:GntR family transcriptional regulator
MYGFCARKRSDAPTTVQDGRDRWRREDMPAQASRARGFIAASHRFGHKDSSGRHVYELLRMRIRSGAIDPDELFVDTALVHSLNATRQAVRHALQSLAEEGLLQRSPRFGTRLNGRIANASLYGELHPQPGDEADPGRPRGRLVVRPVQRKIVHATQLVAAKLRLPPDTRVAVLEQELYIDGEPVGLRSAYLTPDPDAEYILACADADDHDPVSFEEFYERVYHVAAGRSKITVEAVPSVSPHHDILGVGRGAPILLRTLENLDETGRPLAISFTHVRGDRIALTGWLEPPEQARAGPASAPIAADSAGMP